MVGSAEAVEFYRSQRGAFLEPRNSKEQSENNGHPQRTYPLEEMYKAIDPREIPPTVRQSIESALENLAEI